MTPLTAVTLALAAGLFGGLRSAPPGAALYALAACSLVLLLVRLRGAAVLAFVLAGAVLGALRSHSAGADCRTRFADGVHVRVAGAPLALPVEGVAVRVRGEVRGAAGVPCGTRVVRVHASARHHALLDSQARAGGGLVLHGRWMTYPPAHGWPRSPEYAGGVLLDSARAAGPVKVSRFARVRIAQQARLRALLPERWGFAEALLLAQKSGLEPDTRRRWVAAGLVHLLAISGMHVGLIAGGVLLLAGALGMPPRAARRGALVLTAAYVLFLGAPSAALRALLQAVLLLGSLELQRPAEPFNALATAALVILVLEPLALLDPGFQLSFAGMVGLFGWRPAVAAALPRRLPASVRDGLAAGIAASALTMPIAALHFGTASWIGIAASLVAVPVLGVALGALVLALAVSALCGATAGVHAVAADVPLRLLDGIARAAARVPGGHGYVAASTILAMCAAVAVALLVRRALEARPPRARSAAPAAVGEERARRARPLRVGIAGACALVVVAWLPIVARPHDGRVEIHAIDVGQGDAFAIRTPTGRWLLVDAGPRTLRSDAGRDRVVPYLLARGARRLDALILTHPDADHIGGAAAVLDAFDVALVIDPGLAAGKDIFIDLLAAARRADQRWIAGRSDIAFRIDGVAIALLYPIGSLDADASANDNSVVFRLTFGRFAALFLGDAPVAVEEQLVARHGPDLAAAVLKVGHHGSTTSTGDALLRAARPNVALVSAGRRNRYGHPAPGVLRRLAQHDVRILRTDRLGTFVVRADRAGTIEIRGRAAAARRVEE